MPTVRVRRTPSGLCCLEWVSFYGGWCGLRESGFCRMGPHGALHAGGLSGTPAALSVGNGPPDSQFACLGIVCIQRTVRGVTDGSTAK